ncbi:hypothetical protein [Flavobacterium solisilvae]|uniref:Uncharacterized protein n=1 Tax=Flavobacterium solisilvae TaxID=1852019 RepID=A0ABX1QX64_9FLAO|nr:hypothetical protein [Flavobacterium solisilvae]NMH25923.1 hypothetical protein [Flavobacterium solisilvae]
MKKLVSTFGLLALLLVVTSFTTPIETGGKKPVVADYTTGGKKPVVADYTTGGKKPVVADYTTGGKKPIVAD